MDNLKSKLSRRDYVKMSLLGAGSLVLPRFAIGQGGSAANSKLNIALVDGGGIAKTAFRDCQPENVLAEQKGRSLFNGRDLTGWKYKDSEPFTGKKESLDKRFSVQDGILRVNKGEGIQKIWTTEEFEEDFMLTLEFRASVNADSGIYIRGPQLQCRDYLVAGPYKELKKYKPQDWNEIVVVVKGQTATCTCNGEPLAFDRELPLKGPIGLEADRNQMEYRNIQITLLK